MITVITGPPCSGKTTHARQHARPGDIIIDFDAIAQALGSGSDHDHPDWHRKVAAEARHAAIAAVLAGPRPRDAWIIDAAPGQRRLAQYHAAGARILRLDADRAELHRRATADSRPQSCHRAIDAWTPQHGSRQSATADPAHAARTQW